MPPRNYKFEKRQKDLAKSKKKEEKLQKKLMKKNSDETLEESGNMTEASTQEDSFSPADSAQAQPETNH